MKNIFKYLVIILIFLFSAELFTQSNYVVFLYLDGFRYDYLNRGITPNIDKLAQAGIRAEEMNPVFPTVFMPNYMSLLTGCYPENHGIIFSEILNKKTGENYSTGDDKSINDSYWYSAEMLWETSRKNGILTASVMLPCGEFQERYLNPDYYISNNEKLTTKFRILEMLRLLRLPGSERPHIIGAYFGEADESGHIYGPESDEVKSDISEIDGLIGMLADSLKKTGIYDSTDIFILSGYGMANVINFQTINIDKILLGTKVQVANNGTSAYIYGDANSIDTVKKRLSDNNKFIRFYETKDIPDSLNIRHNPNAPDLLVLPDIGWLLNEDKQIQISGLKGVHGYPPDKQDMKGIFIANGKSFKQNLKIKSVSIIDIYPLICHIMGMKYPDRTDGNINRIKDILK